jgi:hypothetical protein
MGMILREKAEFLGTFRWMEVFLMETLARWVPTTPEMEVKVLFGRHMWDAAQHADALGKRTFEMRAPLHYTLPPLEEYQQCISALREVEDTCGRVHAIYDVLLPALEARYREYLACSDPLLDEPSFRVIERIFGDIERMQEECGQLRCELGAALLVDRARVANWRAGEAGVAQFVAHGQGTALARGAQA